MCSGARQGGGCVRLLVRRPRCLRKPQRRFVEEDVAGLSDLLKPQGDAHRLADRMRLGARDHLACADADADREPGSPAALELLAQIRDALTRLYACA